MEQEATKKCKLCGETILEIAVKCKHCGASFNESSAKENIADLLGGQKELLGVLMLVVPVVATLLVWFWIGNMNLLQSPGSKLNGLMLLTIIGTAALAAVEANRVGIGNNINKNGKKESGPIAWFFIITLLWIIGYPAYLYKRSKYGLKNHLLPAILVMLVFIISFSVLSYRIEAKIEQIRMLYGG